MLDESASSQWLEIGQGSNELGYMSYELSVCVCVCVGGGGLQHLLANMTALVYLVLLVTLRALLCCLCWEYVSKAIPFALVCVKLCS